MCIADNEKCNIGTVVGIIALAFLQTSASAAILIQIDNPTNNSSFIQGEFIMFSGNASGGIAPYNYSWTSSIDGFIGKASTIYNGPFEGNRTRIINYSLSPGTHKITMTVNDSSSLTNSTSTNITVNPASTTNISGQSATGVMTWSAYNFPAFWQENDKSSETLHVLSVSYRDITDRGLWYNTTKRLIPYKVYSATGNTVMNGEGGGGYYAKVGWFGRGYVALRGKANKMAKLILEQSETESKTLLVGETWDMGDGYTLKLGSTDVKALPLQAWVILNKSGTKLDDKVIANGSVYTYVERSIGGESDVPMFVTYFDNISTNSVRLKYTWLISYNILEPHTSDIFENLEIMTSSSDGINMTNKDKTITLYPGSTINIADGLRLKVNDTPDLQYYPEMTVITGLPSVESSTGKGTVIVNTDTGTVENLTAINVSDIPEPPPAGANLYYGLFRFNITGLSPGGSANITLAFPDSLPAGTTYWKYGANATNTMPHWYTIPSTIDGNELTIMLTDGGDGDDDLAANGNIRDDGGPSIPEPLPPQLNILTSAPSSPVHDIEGAARTFNITINRTANVTWFINGTQVQSNEGVTDSTYTNTSASLGTWIVNATATHANGMVSQEWTWIVMEPKVHNLNTGENFSTIQAAIDDANTLNGHTILVDSGTYYENVNVTKRLTLRGEDNGSGIPVVDAQGIGSAITLSAEGCLLERFSAVNASNFYMGGGGIRVNSNNNIIINNQALNNSRGIYLESSSNNTIMNNTMSSNTYRGIAFSSSNSNTLTDNIISSNNVGIVLDVSGNNTIYNNIFNNIVNFGFSGASFEFSANTWNTTKTSGTNIVGGSYLGGNFWAHPSGFSPGFSQTCSDSDKDGICDSPYILDINNTDYLPLAVPAAPPTGAPDITSSSPLTSTVMDNVGAARKFNIIINQTVNVSWQINGTEVFNETGVPTSSYTNTSAALGTWNVTAVASNANGTDMKMWEWIVIALGAPNITSFNPPALQVMNNVGDSRTFNITVNQIVDVVWYLNGTAVSSDSGVTTSSYTNTSAAQGTWNVSAAASNENGTVMQMWEWDVTAIIPPQITSFDPPSPVMNNVSESRTFTITTDQTVDVVWYLNGTAVSSDSGVTTSSYTNTSAAQGSWNVTAVASNTNGTDMKMWEWIVTPLPLKNTISGYVINDINGNGIQDAGETGLPGWNIRLIGLGVRPAGINKGNVTDTHGFYIFENLQAGSYMVTETMQGGYIMTGASVKVVALEEGKNAMVNFTNRPISSMFNIRLPFQ